MKEKEVARPGAAWVGTVAEPDHFLECRGFMVVLGRDTATFNATGMSVNAGVSHALAVRNGKITSFTQYRDIHGWHLAKQP